jgi:hypothetical protein
MAELTSSENKKGTGLVMELLGTCYFEEDIRRSYILRTKQAFVCITADTELVFKVPLQSLEISFYPHWA